RSLIDVGFLFEVFVSLGVEILPVGTEKAEDVGGGRFAAKASDRLEVFLVELDHGRRGVVLRHDDPGRAPCRTTGKRRDGGERQRGKKNGSDSNTDSLPYR